MPAKAVAQGVRGGAVVLFVADVEVVLDADPELVAVRGHADAAEVRGAQAARADGLHDSSARLRASAIANCALMTASAWISACR